MSSKENLADIERRFRHVKEHKPEVLDRFLQGIHASHRFFELFARTINETPTAIGASEIITKKAVEGFTAEELMSILLFWEFCDQGADELQAIILASTFDRLQKDSKQKTNEAEPVQA